MAFDTDACRFRNVGDVDNTDTGVHRSNLPFFDICWTKIISLRAPENPRKLVAIAALRLDHPEPIKVPVKLGAKANLHGWAVLLLHHPEDVMLEVTRVWSFPVQTFDPQIPADIALLTVRQGSVTADDDSLATPINPP